MKLMTGNNYNTSQNCIKLWRLKWKVHLLLWRHIKRVNNESLNLEKCHCKHTMCPADVCFLLLYQKGGWQQKHYVPMCCFFALPRRVYGRQHLTPEQSEGSNFGGEKTLVACTGPCPMPMLHRFSASCCCGGILIGGGMLLWVRNVCSSSWMDQQVGYGTFRWCIRRTVWIRTGMARISGLSPMIPSPLCPVLAVSKRTR